MVISLRICLINNIIDAIMEGKIVHYEKTMQFCEVYRIARGCTRVRMWNYVQKCECNYVQVHKTAQISTNKIAQGRITTHPRKNVQGSAVLWNCVQNYETNINLIIRTSL